MTAVRFERRGDRYALRFTYDPTIVALIKTIPAYTRSWNPTAKIWLVIDAYAEPLGAYVGLGAQSRNVRSGSRGLDGVRVYQSTRVNNRSVLIPVRTRFRVCRPSWIRSTPQGRCRGSGARTRHCGSRRCRRGCLSAVRSSNGCTVPSVARRAARAARSRLGRAAAAAATRSSASVRMTSDGEPEARWWIWILSARGVLVGAWLTMR
jgi:hypothetical protein